MLRRLVNGNEKGGQLWTNMLMCNYGLNKDAQVLSEFIQKIQYLDSWPWAHEVRILRPIGYGKVAKKSLIASRNDWFQFYASTWSAVLLVCVLMFIAEQYFMPN